MLKRLLMSCVVMGLASVARASETAQPALDLSPGAVAATLMAGEDPAAGEIAEAQAGREPFDKGSWSLQSYGSFTHGEDDGDVFAGRAGFGYYFLDGFSVGLEAVGYHVDVNHNGGDTGGQTGGAGLDLIFRWHVLREGRLTVYLDLAGGVMVTRASFPANGTHFNFTPQGGVGAGYNLFDNTWLMGGARWFHVSNGNHTGSERNPTYDSVMFYAGVMFTF